MIPNATNLLLASDIEANNLLTKVSKLWCLVSIDVITEELYLFHDFPEFDNAVVQDPYDEKEYTIPPRTGTFAEGVEFWKRVANGGGKLIVHNCFGYDKPVLERFFPDFKTPMNAWVDTLVRSKMQWYERPTPKGARGAHGLQAWGCRFKVFKPDVTDWSFMDAFKLHRCIEDCRIQRLTYLYLEKERTTLRDKVGIDFSEAYPIDDEYNVYASEQECNGALIDVEHYEECVNELDGFIKALEVEIEPQLPPTINRPPKIPNSDLALKLGLPNASKVKDKMVTRVRNGETYETPYKFYSNPSVVFSTKKTKVYSAFHLSYGQTQPFSTIKALRDHIKNEFPDTVFKYPDKKGTSDWMVDCYEDEIKTVTKNISEYFGVPQDDLNYFGDLGFLTKVEFAETKLTQQDQVKQFLVALGWKPEEWNFKRDSNKQLMKAEEDFEFFYPAQEVNGHRVSTWVNKGELIPTTPKLTEKSFKSLPEGLGRKIADYNTYQHRRRFIQNPEDETKGILNNLMPNDRVPCGLNVYATATGRSSQSVWVNSPSTSALYGDKIRKGLIAPEGRLLVGSDMKSAQLSIAAYYAKNWEYFDSIINGEEFKVDSNGEKIINPATGHPFYLGESGHCVSARAFGIVNEADWQEAVRTQNWDLIEKLGLLRKYSKGASFACLPVDNTTVYSKDHGWVSYNDLEIGMEVLTYNRDRKINEFAPIEHIVTFDDKEVIEMGNSSWKFESTPDHRWLGLRRSASNGKHYEVEEFIQTQNIKSEFKLYNSALRDDSFISKSKLTIDEAKVLGWILGDGFHEWSEVSNAPSTSHGTKQGCRAVIHQSLKKYHKEVEDLLTREDALTSCYCKDNILKDGTNSVVKVFGIKATYLRKLWDKTTFSRTKKEMFTKKMFDDFIKNNKNEVLNAFLEAFYLAEGWLDKKTNTKLLAQNEGTLLEGVKDICVMLGIDYTVQFKGNEKLSNYKCYNLRMRNKSYTSSTNFKKVSKGVRKTFCITTRNSTFIAKQGEIVTITGNCIFGASGKKLANILKVPESEGNAKKKMYLERVGLENVIKYLQRFVKKHPRAGGGYIPLPFGYWAYCNMPHKLFNYLDQGTEAVCQKLSVNLFMRWLHKEVKAGNIDAMKILDVHDEFLVDSHEDCAHEVGKMMCACYKKASDMVFEWHNDHPNLFPNEGKPLFAFNLDGGYDVGNNYLEVH